jgi:hypothetical protein
MSFETKGVPDRLPNGWEKNSEFELIFDIDTKIVILGKQLNQSTYIWWIGRKWGILTEFPVIHILNKTLDDFEIYEVEIVKVFIRENSLREMNLVFMF